MPQIPAMTQPRSRLAVVGNSILSSTVGARMRELGFTVDVWPHMPANLAAYDALLCTETGVTPVKDMAMAAMGAGVSVFICSPLVVQAHGELLSRCAQSQCVTLGLEAAGFGALPMRDFLAVAGASRVILSAAGGANAVLARMAYRAESPVVAERHVMEHMLHELPDVHGKTTLARAHALYAQMTGNFAPRVQRVGLDRMTPALVATLRSWGMSLRFAVDMTDRGLVAAPMVLAEDHPLAQAFDRDMMIVESPAGDVVVQAAPDETARVVTGFALDVRRWAAGNRPGVLLAMGPREETGVHALVAGAYSTVQDATTHAVALAEQIDPTGQTVRLVKGRLARETEALVLPFAGIYRERAGLRLVG